MKQVEITNRKGVRHRVTFAPWGNAVRAIRVDTLVRNTNGNSEFWTRKLWETGDLKMPIAAKCAINAAGGHVQGQPI